MPLKDLPLDAQPREKLLARGPGSLADAELLAILLRTGVAGKNVLQLAQELLSAPAIDDASGNKAGGFWWNCGPAAGAGRRPATHQRARAGQARATARRSRTRAARTEPTAARAQSI